MVVVYKGTPIWSGMINGLYFAKTLGLISIAFGLFLTPPPRPFPLNKLAIISQTICIFVHEKT